jgi:hypothetical protein
MTSTNLNTLQNLLNKINDYESGLYQIIKSLVFYQMKDSEELREAVILQMLLICMVFLVVLTSLIKIS